jgi:hypothetical protein
MVMGDPGSFQGSRQIMRKIENVFPVCWSLGSLAGAPVFQVIRVKAEKSGGGESPETLSMFAQG